MTPTTPTHVHGDAEAMLAKLFPDPAAKLSEFGDFLSRTVRNVVALIGCDYSRACELVRCFKAELLDKFKAGLSGEGTVELEA